MFVFILYFQNFIYKENNIDINTKKLLEDVQNIHDKLNVVESTVDCSDNVSDIITHFSKILMHLFDFFK